MKTQIGFKDLLNEVKIAYYLFRCDLSRDPIKRVRYMAQMMRCLTLRPQVLWESYERNGVR